MIIVLKQHAPADKVQAFCNELNSMGFQINDSVGSDTHILGLIGDTKALAESWVLANPVVETCRRVSEPYKKANRKFHPDDTIVDVAGHKIGGGYFAVMSAEYIMAEGNPNVVLCERGIRTFETSMRNTLDISAVPMLKKMTHLPVVIDPSHAAGIAFMVPALAQAAVAVGADGLMIETHNDPAKAKSDGAQSLTPDQFDELMQFVSKEVEFFGKKMN